MSLNKLRLIHPDVCPSILSDGEEYHVTAPCHWITQPNMCTWYEEIKGFPINGTSVKLIERLWFLQWEYRSVVLYVARSYSVLIRSVSQHVGAEIFLSSWYLLDMFKRSHYILFLNLCNFNSTHPSPYRFSSNTFHPALHLQSCSAFPTCHVFRPDNIVWGVLIVKFLTCSFLHSLIIFSHLGPNIILSNLNSITLAST